MDRYAHLRRIQRLDPQKDHLEIYHLSTCYEFPWDHMRALEFAFYRTYCIPSISALLASTGELSNHTQKRYDDTALITLEISAFGYDSERGRAALRRLNRIHKHYTISNDDYLYVLSAAIYEPIRWIEAYGWRKMCKQEKLASYYFWREVGKRMNIKDIPETFEAFEQYNRAFERDHFRYTPSNQQVGEPTRDLFLSWFPVPKRAQQALRPAIYALLDDATLDALGFPRPPRWLRRMLSLALKGRAVALRFFPARTTPFLYPNDAKHRSYPDGYSLEMVGPSSMLDELNKKATSVAEANE